MKNLLSISLFVTFLSGSVFGQSVRTEIAGNKHMINLSREISSFNHLRIIALDVDLQKGEANSISIDAESNIIGQIITKVVGDTLVIQFERNQPLRNITKPKIKLTFSNLNSILGSASNIKLLSPFENDSLLVKLQTKSSIEGIVKLNFLNLRMTTLCNADISGSTHAAHMELYTESILNAKNLIIKDLTLIEETHCKAELNVSEQLTATLFVESTVNNVGNAKSNITYPSMDQMTSMKSIGRTVDLYQF